MDETINPCDDFYKFSCGNFGKYNPRPGNKGIYNALEVIRGEVRKKLINALTTPPSDDEPCPIRFIRQLYQKCTDKDYLAKNNFTKLQLFRNHHVYVPPRHGHKRDNRLENLIVKSILYGIPFLLSFKVDLDPSDPRKRILMIDQPSFKVSKENLIADESDEKAKKIRDAYSNFIAAGYSWMEPDKPPIDVEIAKNNILGLEIELAKIATKDQDRRDESKKFQRFKKSQLRYIFKGIDLGKIIDKILDYRHDRHLEVIVADVPYFNNISKILEVSRTHLKDFLNWKIIENYGPLVSEQFNDAQFEFLKVYNGLSEKPDQEERCINLILQLAPNVVGRVYIDAVGFSYNDKLKLTQMVFDLHNEMDKIIANKPWIDLETKVKAREKLQSMNNRTNIGYPEWIKDDRKLTKSFRYHFRASDDAFKLTSQLTQSLVHDSVKNLNDGVDLSHTWSLSPAVVGADYVLNQNSLTIPVAILHGTMFDSNRPDYLNYGAIGYGIGHETTHGFDDQGAQYDKDGRLVNWWSEETLKKFKEATGKVVKQYSDIKDNTTGLNLNGQNTQGENIADNGGIREAYNAYFGQKRRDLSLIGFEDWTPEKLFFLSYANVWCGVITPEELRFQVNSYNHSPNEYRVNVPLKNFKKFSDAYGCKAGDPMNPEDKDRVEVW